MLQLKLRTPRPLKNALLLLALGTVSLGGCDSGPELTHLIADADALWGGHQKCDPVKWPNYFCRLWEKSNLTQCVTAQDMRRSYRTCKDGGGFAEMNRCIYYADTDRLNCADGKTRTRAEVTNWTCLSAQDADEALRYCRKKKHDE